jgi:hypothetical protein
MKVVLEKKAAKYLENLDTVMKRRIKEAAYQRYDRRFSQRAPFR